MLVSLGGFSPAAIQQRDRRANLGSCSGRWVVERPNERLQRLPRMVACSQRKRAKVARQCPADRLAPRGSLLCPCPRTPTTPCHFDFIPLIYLICLIQIGSDGPRLPPNETRLAISSN